MKKNMHIRTLAIVVATLTSAQISGVATSMAEKHNVAYAAENSEQANDLSLQLSNTVTLSADSTTGQAVTTQPNTLTIDYSTGAVKVNETLGSGNQLKWFLFDSQQTTSAIKVDDKLSDVFPGINFDAKPAITSDNNGKYLVVAEVDSSNLIKGIGEVQIKTSAAINAIKSVSISGTERVGKTLTANVTYNTDVLIPSVKYQWLKCSVSDGEYHDISGATSSEYEPDSDDKGEYIKVRVTSTINETDTITSNRTGDIGKKVSSSSGGSSSSSSSTADSDDIERDIKNADDNEIVTEGIDDEPKIEEEVFECLQNHSDITLVLSGDDYEWTFKGKDIKDPSVIDGKLDTRIDTSSPNEADIKKLTNGVDVVNLYFKYSGKLPGKAKVEVNVGSGYNGNQMYLYYYNEDKKQLELVQSNVKVEDGSAEFTIEHCSDYVLSKVPITGAKTDGSINNTNTTAQSQNQWKQLNDGTWQYIENGSLINGWKYINSKWYYMNINGVMQTNWLYDGGKWYYLNSSGDMATGWKQLGSAWYYLGGDGAMLTGWIYDGGNWYYLDSNGAMVTGSKVINGQRYLFNDNGIWQ